MKSPTYGDVTLDEMLSVIEKFISKSPKSEYEVTIGTDSQNFDKTKVVKVLSVHRKGHGGVYFYDVQYVKRMNNITEKLYYETQQSLDMASKIADKILKMKLVSSIIIHIDAGYNGPTSKLIHELTGWIKSCGYDVRVKPESYAASGIADRISK